MRFLKILFILFSVMVVGSVIYIINYEFTRTQTIPVIPVAQYIYLGLALSSAVLNILYQIKSFRFYRRAEKQNLDKKVPKIYWIGAICFFAFLLYVTGASIYGIIRFWEFGYSGQDIFRILIFLVPGILGFLEISLLKKRIKRLKNERDHRDEIEDIGSQSL